MAPFPVMRILTKGKMPTIPEKCGPIMQKLIPRCWSMKAEDHPSFDDILNEFQAANMAIIAGADVEQIRAFLIGVLGWEARSRLQTSDTQNPAE
jgi:hypothetical protein